MKWKRYLRPELLFDLSLVAFALFFLINSFSYSFRNRVFPLSFAILCLIFAVAYLAKYIKKANSWTDEEVAAYQTDWRPLLVSVIMFAYTAGIYYLGILLATCLFTGVFVYFWGKQKLWIALICSVVSFSVIYAVFGLLMRMPLYRGVLF